MCRLRVGPSYLNADSFKIGHSDTNRCECGQKETELHISLCVLLSNIFCTINSMIDCRSLRAFQVLKSLKYFCMVTILNLKNLTAEVYPLLLLCKQIFSQLKTKNFSMVSWCIHLRSSLDISYLIFSFLFSWSSHLIHIRSLWSCCVSFPPRSVILYFILVLKIKFSIPFGSRKKSQYCSDRRNTNTFPCSWSKKYL